MTVRLVDDLKNISAPLSNEVYEVLGYYIAGDTGGGSFFWDPQEPVISANKGTIIAGASGTSGCFKRLFSGDINTKWFGAKGDGIADDAESLELAMNFAAANGLRCYIPKTNQWYHMSRGVRVHATAGLVIDIYSNGALIKPNAVPAQPVGHLSNLTGFDERHFLGLGEGGTYSQRELNRNITVKLHGLNVDGSAIASPFAPEVPASTPVGWAFVIAAEFVYISECNVYNLFGTAFELYSPGLLRINDCITKNVGGRGATVQTSEFDYDQIGNAIHIAYAREGGDLFVSKSSFSGKLVSDAGGIKTIRTRTGIVSEFSDENYQLRVNNCRLENFGKIIHVEHKLGTTSDPIRGTCNLYLEGTTCDHFNVLQAYANCGGRAAITGCNLNFREGDTNDDGYSSLYVGQYQSVVTLEFTGCKIRHITGRRLIGLVGVSLFETCEFTFEQQGYYFADTTCKMIHCTFINFTTDAATGHFFKTSGNNKAFTLIACTFTGNTGVISYPANANNRPEVYYINCFDDAGFGLKSNAAKTYKQIFDNADGSCFGGRTTVTANFAINPDNIPTNCWHSRQSFGLIMYGCDNTVTGFSRDIIANPSTIGGYYLLRVRWTTNGHAYDIQKMGNPAAKGFDLTYAFGPGGLLCSAAATGGANVKMLEFVAFPIELWNQVVPPGFGV